MKPAQRWVLVLVVAALSLRAAAAADIRWKAAAELLAVWTDNVYIEADDSQTAPVDTAGASLGGGFGLTSSTPRSEFDIGWKGSYRNFPEETNANNLEQYLVLTWSTLVSQRTSFNLYETASFSPEVDNSEDRGVDQGLTVGTRAKQFRNMTGLGMTTMLSQRWSFRADYNYRLLDNGDIERPEGAPPTGVVCNPGFCVPGDLDGDGTIDDQNGDGTIDDADGDGTIDSVPLSVENLELLDERGQTANLGITRQLSPSSDLTFSATYIHNTTTDDLFGGTMLRKSESYGGNVVYAWWRTRSGGEAPLEPTGPVDLPTPPSAVQPAPLPAPGQPIPGEASPPVPDEEQPGSGGTRTQTPPPARPGEGQVAPLSAGSDGRPHGGIQAARVAAQRAAGPRSGRFFELPTDALNLWFGAGVYTVTDTLGPELVELLQPENESESSIEYSAEIGVIRTYGRGALSAGITHGVRRATPGLRAPPRGPRHGVSTFEGLGRVATITDDANQDGTFQDSEITTVELPAGSAVRTTLYGSYVFTLSRVSHFAFSLNATRRSDINGQEFDSQAGNVDVNETDVTALGAAVGYDLQFADWGGIRVSYRYTTQKGTGLLEDLDYDKNTVTLGMFVTTR